MANSFTVRRALPDDALAVAAIFGRGGVEEVTARLRGRPGTTATVFYLIESEADACAVFALTELGRLSPGGSRRYLLHEVKVRSSFRGSGAAEALFDWLRSTVCTGADVDLIALSPLDQAPPVFDRFGLVQSHRAFRLPPDLAVPR